MRFQHKTLLRLFLGVFSFTAFSAFSIAQKNSVSGVVTDTLEKKKLQYAAAVLIDLKDTTLYKSVRTDEKGSFAFWESRPVNTPS